MDLAKERLVIETQQKLLKRIPAEFVTRQLNDLDLAIAELGLLDGTAVELIEHYASDKGLSLLSKPNSDALWRIRGGLLLWANENRKFRARRFKGRFMEAIKPQNGPVEGSAERYLEALTMMVDRINETLADPKSGLSHLWRHLVLGESGDSLWLYHHHPSEKYQSIHFRISIRPHRGSNTLQMRLETFIPFGSLGDPAAYKMAESKNYKYNGWQTHVLETCSHSLTGTINLSSSSAESEGQCVGQNLSYIENSAETEAKTKGVADSLSKGSALANSTNFSLNKSKQWNTDLREWQESSTGTSLSEGSVVTETMQHAQSTMEQDLTSKTRGVGSQWGYQINTNKAVTLTKCLGVTEALGKSVQYEVWNYGLDMGEPNEVHLKKWKDAYHEAADIYDGVVGMFEGCCEFIRKRIDKANNFVNDSEPHKLSPDYMSTKILVEGSSAPKV